MHNVRTPLLAAVAASGVLALAGCADKPPTVHTAPVTTVVTVTDSPVVSPDPDKTYLYDLGNAGVPYTTPENAINVGKNICAESRTFPRVVIITALEQNYPGLDDNQRVALYNAAVENYCPEVR